MEVVGYSDRLSVAPGETIRFIVSCELPTYRADVVRLIHGDESPRGPGFKEEPITTSVSGEYPGRKQEIHNGSYVIVPDSPALRQRGGFTLQAWISPTTPQKGVQGILTKWSTADGSGVCYSSRLRPVVNMRPKYNFWLFDCPHQFAADLHLVDWLEAKGHPFDVITDEDLHFEGANLLAHYKVILTGTHPEYWSEPMRAAMETYLHNGGRLMYLGGNGFYWVTSFAPERPHVIEVRRWGGIRTWEAAPGEYYHSTTGEPGGLWRFRGKAPQKLVGIGFTAQGFDRSAPYHRQAGSFDPRTAFIFAGIGQDELIGDFESLVLSYGAAGFELDRVEPALGTPPHTLVLASSSGHSDAYQHVGEEVLMTDPLQGGTVNPGVRADMVYFAYLNGGAVFATGSIAWCGALSYNRYDNTVSRITDNVLRRFASVP